MCIFVTVGVEIFSKDSPQGFGNFYRGFYTLFGVIAYGYWPDEELKAFNEDGSPNIAMITFIYVYVVVVVLVLLQITVAVVLEKFFQTSQKTMEDHAMKKGEFTKQPLDAILEFLAKSFMSAEDLQMKMRQLFRNLDVDRSGNIFSKECSILLLHIVNIQGH